LEKNIDTLLKRWLSEKITHLTRNTVCDLLTNFGVFQSYSHEFQLPARQAPGVFQRLEMEQVFMEYLWEKFLLPTIPLDDDQVRLEVVSEVLKVLLSPYMRK
jgi:hypothetical protein